jgi:hypothetical protein
MINTILPYLGYNRHTPRAVVYAAPDRGGIGLIDLATEQGTAHIAYIIGSLRCTTETKVPIMAIIEAYIIATGIIGNPFVMTEPRPYIISPWIDITREMLKNIDGTIEISRIEFIHRHRIRDKGIMDVAMKYTQETTKLQAINNCRLYLQVNTIAEITNEIRDRILEEAYFGTTNINGPAIKTHSVSTMHWPTQKKPPLRAWKLWKKFIRTMVQKGSLNLKHPLSRWLQNSATQRIWKEKRIRVYKTKYQQETSKQKRKNGQTIPQHYSSQQYRGSYPTSMYRD